MPAPLLPACGEKVGMRGLSTHTEFAEAPLTPTLSTEVGFTRLRSLKNAEIGQARFRMHAGRGSDSEEPT